MNREQCEECICLVSGFNGAWVCDECGISCEKLTRCPETGEQALLEKTD